MSERLSASELANLWGTNYSNSMMSVLIPYYLTHTKDQTIGELLKKALTYSEQILNETKKYLEQEEHPLPIGFTDEDVDLNGPKVFTDEFHLLLLNTQALYGQTVYSLGISTAFRADIRNFFKQSLNMAVDLFDQSMDLIIQKGLHRPVILAPTYEKAGFVEKTSFIGNLFGEDRPLTVMEMNNLVMNLKRAAVAAAFAKAVIPCVTSTEIRDYLIKGKNLAIAHVDTWQKFLSENGIANFPTWENEIIEVHLSPMSEKIIFAKWGQFVQAAVGRYGTSLATCQRRDIGAQYAKIIAETAFYGDEGTKIGINHGIIEQIPLLK